MQQLTKGSNTALPLGPITLRVAWSGLSPSIEDVDVSAFVLSAAGRVSGDAGMIFYGQPASPDGAVRFEALSDNGETRLLVDPARLAPGVARVAITATLTAAGVRPFSDVKRLGVTLHAGGAPIAAFDLDTASATEAALILGEVYERNGAWKFRAVGQGFNGGLQPLAEHYGVEIQASPPPPPPPAAPPPASSVNLSKISLNKTNPSVNLTKKGGTLGEIRVNLNWHRQAPPDNKKSFFGFKKSSGVDLDLCCLYELADGTRFGVQALGKMFGSFEDKPYIHLLGDDRTGAASDGEWLRVNGDRWDKIKRVLIFAMIYEGAPNWSATDGVVTLYAPGNPEIEVRLEGTSNESICAAVMLENVGGDLKISRENRYFTSAPQMDEHYRFNLSWGTGRK